MAALALREACDVEPSPVTVQHDPFDANVTRGLDAVAVDLGDSRSRHPTNLTIA